MPDAAEMGMPVGFPAELQPIGTCSLEPGSVGHTVSVDPVWTLLLDEMQRGAVNSARGFGVEGTCQSPSWRGVWKLRAGAVASPASPKDLQLFGI